MPFPSCSRTGEYEHGTSSAALRSNKAVYRFIERNKEAYEKGRMVGQIVKRRIAKKSDGEHERGVAFADPKDLEEMERKGKKKKMMMKEKEPAAAKTEKRTTKSTTAKSNEKHSKEEKDVAKSSTLCSIRTNHATVSIEEDPPDPVKKGSIPARVDARVRGYLGRSSRSGDQERYRFSALGRERRAHELSKL